MLAPGVTKAPCGGEKAGRSPVDRGKRGTKRSVGRPSRDRHGPRQPPRLAPSGSHPGGRPDARYDAGGCYGPPRDRGYASGSIRRFLERLGLVGVISNEDKPAPLGATERWVVERTNSWTNAHKKLVWCTERKGPLIDFWIAFSSALIIVGRLVREVWSRYRWEGRLSRRP